MQTFLPYADFAASAAVLDERRLGKQRVETLQILRALTWPTYGGWKNHPATAMWRGFVPALVAYGLAVCGEWARRGHPDAVAGELLGFTGGCAPDPAALSVEGRLPPWLGFEPFHLSHRSSLLRKSPEHYRGVFPELPDDLPYVWPAPAFPRWPVRRPDGGLAPLPLDAAAALLGPGGPSEEGKRTVEALASGADVAAVGGRTTGLLAGLCLPGPTLWISPHVGGRTDLSAPLVDELRPAGPPATGGRLATSVARAPEPADVAAVRREATAPAEFVFHRPDVLAAPAVRAALRARRPGLVVVEHNDALGESARGLIAKVRRQLGKPPLLALGSDVSAAGHPGRGRSARRASGSRGG